MTIYKYYINYIILYLDNNHSRLWNSVRSKNDIYFSLDKDNFHALIFTLQNIMTENDERTN